MFFLRIDSHYKIWLFILGKKETDRKVTMDFDMQW